MNDFNIEFDEFINERIENKLDKNEFYKKDSLIFENLQQKLYNCIPKEEHINLDKFLNIIFSMKSKEFYIAYQIGFYDGFSFSNNIKDK